LYILSGLYSRWVRRVRKRRSRWSCCRAGSITSFKGKIRVGLFGHFVWSLDGGVGCGRGGRGGTAAGQGQSLFF
jgi:hypothetical protein